ncbi:oxidoreductase [Pikeienuella piscinae]|uniref:Oxidoreductase n=1 Tax=Pikeienuella piscinae TaxID=2748098 RepID=A0A7L5BUH2_9RHOB|nr:PDR/VanB family oxidoreductase [Pikeienuella piscinae]QIE54901.1 oxidoreductase [Pikeienuella piscinae]
MENGHAEPPLQVVVESVGAEARDAMTFTLAAADGGALPSCAPGGHIELALPGGLLRHYSLINDCENPDLYMIAVGRAASSRGGSDHIHSQFREGTQVQVNAVRNTFRLDPEADAYCFVAGGIGITPIMSMIRWCRRNDRPWRLIYAARSRQRAAFYEDLCAVGADNVQFHFDDEAGHVLDVGKALAGLAPGEQVYCCGPEPLMVAVTNVTRDRPAGSVHFEWFTAPEQDPAITADDTELTVDLRRSGVTLTVPPGRSILEAIEAAGVAHPFSCREGACGTCATTVLEGAPDHRDFVLSDEERARNDTMMVCVSRALSGRLVLDI